MVLLVFLRTLILYIVVVTVVRLMGKRQMSQLQPFELVITIMISELAAVPMQDTGVPLINGIIPILTLLFMQILISLGTLKSNIVKKAVCGSPTILIDKGIILEDQLKKLRYTLNDLLEQLRIKGYFNITDIEYAILETDGDISVIPKSQKRPLTPTDMNIPTKYEGLPINLIIDGKINRDSFQKANIQFEWLLSILNQKGIKKVEDVFYAGITSDGNLFIQGRGGKIK